MKMEKTDLAVVFLLFFIVLASTFPVGAQVTIGNRQAPDPNALLDLKEKDDSTSTKGLLLPRVVLVKSSDPTPLLNNVAGMFVYNTKTANDVTPGIYYNDGDRWMRISSD